MPENVLFEWTIPEYDQHNRGMWWYVFAGLAAVVLIIWSVITLNFLFAVILVMASVILFRQTIQQPRRLTVRVLETGIQVDGTMYEYGEMRNFFLVYEPPRVKTLTVSFRTALRPSLTIPLEKQNPVPLRRKLKEYVEEDVEREGEPATDALGRILKI